MAVKLNTADLEFILRQIKISEEHAAGTALPDIWVDADGNVVPVGTPDAIPAISHPLVPFGLRTVDGTYNNLIPGRETWGAADTPMPRMLDPFFLNENDGDVMPLGAPGGPAVTNNDYGVIGSPSPTNGGHSGNVADADPRIISNLVVDQSIANPAAVEAWFANDAAIAAFHARYGEDANPVRPGEGPPVLSVANASFEADSLASGTAGVFSQNPLGNFTLTAPTGWTISGGEGGLFAPIDTVTNPTGHPGPNVTWLRNGATLSQDNTTMTAGLSYELSLSVGDRSNMAWPGGTARLVAVGPDGQTTVITSIALPTPADGQWANLSLNTGLIPASLDGQTLRIEVQQAQAGGTAQVLVDNVALRAIDGNNQVLAVANASFEADSLASGTAGVFSQNPLGNFTVTAPTGWTISGGQGGLFAPIDTVTNPTGHSGPNVTWLRNGATLSQDNTTMTAGLSYELSLSVGDRTNMPWPGGTARLVAVGPDGQTTVITSIELPTPADGQWADISLNTGLIPANLNGQTLRIEVQQAQAGGSAQLLVDNVSLRAIDGIEVDNIDLATIPNLAPDDGISAPFNAWMTFFGQFFDHGLDLISKSDNGTIFIPLEADDPLIAGANGIVEGIDPTTGQALGDDLPTQLRFMALTRSTPIAGPGADGVMGTADDTDHEGENTTTPFVDQNQTYTSHASHQVFLREYVLDANGHPVSTGKLLDGANGGLPTWAEVKAQAAEMLGIELTDGDVLNIPMLRTDQYGQFIPGVDGMPQIITGIGGDLIPNTDDDITIEGNIATPVNTFDAMAIRIGHSFLDDIAHAANPMNSRTGELMVADDDIAIGHVNTGGTAGTYDNELLDRHFITGDGRGNENIALTSVHHVFHSEHNRQVEANKLTILETGDIDFINEWLLVDIAAGAPVPTDPAALTWDGQRLFQTAKFSTEMQYQHLVFEEFARTVHPNIDPFVFNAVNDINPSIFAEFASVVYRFGHSMLTDSVPRVMVDETTGVVSSDDMGLITAFLNPVAYDNDGAMSHDAAAAAVILGMTSERGSQIDEFIVPSLRSNLLGLPLDLAAINIARGRDTGMPTFNDARAELYQQTNSVWLKPYENWVELASNLKNPMTIVNLLAAYGTHASITVAETLEARRAAAFDIVFGGGAVSEADRLDFLLGRNGWTAETIGLNSIDLWVGGLSERIMPFGGMLGSTFTAIFEAQLEALQDGDRFYYLTRTQGQNLLNELEENSFSKMMLANTNLSDPGPDGIRGTPDDIVSHHIGANAFARYDYVLEVNKANQLIEDPEGNDPVLEALGMGKVVRDDPTTAEVETNYIRVSGGEHVVVGGTNGADTIITSDGDDGIWGDDGDDFIESGFGVDLVNGGGGNDIILDSGDEGDFLKGEDGDDVIASANGEDFLMGGRGKDAIFLGVDAAQIFGGEGDDFMLGGAGADFMMGNEGDDWMEAGGGFDTTAGDNSELFFNSKIIGHDVMFAGSDEHDFDAESGDDIMVQGASVMRNEGMFGFDWVTFKGVAIDAYADMRIKIFTTEEQDILRNRFDKVEALSGWDHNDTLIGDNRVIADPLAGIEGIEQAFVNDGLDQAGIDRIDNLSDIVSITPGLTFWENGNIILGGAGSDLITGNGGDDILDGDRWLNVRIRITSDANAANTPENEIATVDSLKHVFTADDNVVPAWVGKSLLELLVSRDITPGQMNIVREILTADGAGDTDIAIFNDDLAQYTITDLGNGTYTVAHTGFGTNDDVLINDGIDTVRNVEVLRFRDGDIPVAQQSATGVPVIDNLTPTEGQTLTVDLTSIGDINGIQGAISVQWQSFDGAMWVNIPDATNETFTPNDLAIDPDGPQVGRQLRVVATFTDGVGATETVVSGPTAPVGDFWVANPPDVTFNGTEGDDIAFGNDGIDGVPFPGFDGADVLNGNGGNDILDGLGGNDIVNGGAGADTITFDFAGTSGGRDIVDGGTGIDTVEITGDTVAETFRIYTLAEALAANMTGFDPGTEIVITRNGTTNDSIIAELQNIEEIIINGNDGTPPVNAVLGGDTIEVFGDFTQTSLSLNTIHLNGSSGDDTVDISGLTSAHRIVFRGAGGNDALIGNLRPQDVIDLHGDEDPVVTTTDTGMTTVSRGGASVTFDGSQGMPTIGQGEAAPSESDVTVSPLAASGPIVGTASHETLFGTAESDNIMALGVSDMVFGGDGHDNVLAGAGADMVFGDGGNDRLFGEDGDDLIEGGTGDDFVSGGAGDDTFIATTGDGNDVYYGDGLSGAGTGSDTLDMSRILADSEVNLGTGMGGRGHATSLDSGSDVLWSIENFIGGAGDDMITAGRAQNVMDGGQGHDTYRFLSAEDADGDTIASFEPGDRIDLSHIDANGSTSGNGSFALVSDAFSGTGQLLVTHESGTDGEMTIIHGNITDDDAADFSIAIRGRHNLTQDDFQL